MILVRLEPWKLWIALSAVLIGTGCVHFESRPISPAQTLADHQARSLAAPDLRAFLARNRKQTPKSGPLVSWGLDDLILVGLFYHPDLDVARARWAVAQAGRRTASERPNPTLSLTPALNSTTRIPSPWIVTSALDIPIETAGKRGYRMAQAGQLAEAARWNIASVAWTVRSRVRQAFLEFHTAGELLELLQQQQAVQSENLQILEGQFQAGAISAFDRTQARIAADGTRLALQDARRQQAEARVQLADALGLPATALDGVELSFTELDDLPQGIPNSEARRQALLNRTDVLGALAEYAASESALQLEIARQYPDIHLSPGYDFDQGDNKWSIGPSMTLPVFNRNKGAIGEALARRTEAAAVFNAVQAHAIGEIDKAIAGYAASRQKVADTDALRLNLLQQEKSAQAMVSAGEISKADLAALRLQLSASALARLDSLTKSRQAYGLLEDALQGTLGVQSSEWESSPRTNALHADPSHR